MLGTSVHSPESSLLTRVIFVLFDSLGNQFSLVEQSVFVATLLQHFKVASLDFVAPQTANNPIVNQLSGLKVNLTPV